MDSTRTIAVPFVAPPPLWGRRWFSESPAVIPLEKTSPPSSFASPEGLASKLGFEVFSFGVSPGAREEPAEAGFFYLREGLLAEFLFLPFKVPPSTGLGYTKPRLHQAIRVVKWFSRKFSPSYQKKPRYGAWIGVTRSYFSIPFSVGSWTMSG